MRDRRDSMLENQLVLRAGFHNQGKPIEALDAAEKFGPVHQINRDRRLFPPREIKETVLNVLQRRL